MKRTAIIVASVVWILGAIAAAQESRSEISLQGIGFFTSNTNNANINRNVNDTGGLLLGYRYHLNRWLAAEGNYGFARDTQDFTTPNGAFGGKVDIHQMTGDLVFKLPAVAG